MTLIQKTSSPLAIGGLGGSGTRIVATLLQLYGYYFGSDLNEARDNLWFTLLFKRHSALLETDFSFLELTDIFFSALQGDNKVALSKADLIFSLANVDRMDHTSEWLLERAKSLISESSCGFNPRWGWKEPNTHIFIEKFLKIDERLKYIHVLRDPYYMAFSRNQNQLKNWGPLFFDSPIELLPKNSFSLWRKVHERISASKEIWPDRIFILRYEDLMTRPVFLIKDICEFLDLTYIPSITSEIQQLINNPLDAKDFKSNCNQFSEEDIQYINFHWKN